MLVLPLAMEKWVFTIAQGVQVALAECAVLRGIVFSLDSVQKSCFPAMSHLACVFCVVEAMKRDTLYPYACKRKTFLRNRKVEYRSWFHDVRHEIVGSMSIYDACRHNSGAACYISRTTIHLSIRGSYNKHLYEALRSAAANKYVLF